MTITLNLARLLLVGRSLKSVDVVITLEKAAVIDGFPKVIKVDNGLEFISKELDLCAYGKGVKLDHSRPGKPTDNAFAESFNSQVREKYLNQHWFLNLVEAQVKIEAWREDYNTTRPRKTLGYKIPKEFANLDPKKLVFPLISGPTQGAPPPLLLNFATPSIKLCMHFTIKIKNVIITAYKYKP